MTDLEPPKLQNDCFSSMPRGVDWIPVDEALAYLRQALSPVVGREILPVTAALGRVLATDQIAVRANPPAPNSAVDGYGFACGSIGSGAQKLPLVDGRAAAGAPFRGTVPPGSAIRILTGAILPDGVDTVVLEEDVNTDGTHVAFSGGLKDFANARRMGEDVEQGAVAMSAGRMLRAPDLALLVGLGISEVTVNRRLRVGVLSTGDELADPGETTDPARTYDANRPLLLAMIARWGLEPVDLGRVADARDVLRDTLDMAAARVDVILTSGGASAGDEDHMSALLRDAGALNMWRMALKPGRPLALGMWQGVPVFGLPGNPVAAFVTALIFARPACGVLSGGPWESPQGFEVPARFEKVKKAGRREYIRARMTTDGGVEAFASEGSGRISGLTWADGLVELGDDSCHIRPGDLVRFLPYGSFGI